MAQIDRIAVSPAGGDGAAEGAENSAVTIAGLLQAIYLIYNDVPGTTTVTITVPGMDDFELFELTGNTNGIFMPRYPTCDAAGVADDGTGAFYIPNLPVKVAVANADEATDGVVVLLVTI